MNVLIPGRDHDEEEEEEKHELITQHTSTEERMPLWKAIKLLLRVQRSNIRTRRRDSSDPITRAKASLEAAEPRQVYHLLYERFLHKDQAAFSLAEQTWNSQPAAMTNVIEQELSAWDDKRRQLAALLLLHCLKKSIGKETEIATKYAGQQPTLIACAACDTIIASTVSDKTQVETVIRILEMWRMNQNIDPIEQVGWQQLHIFMQSSEWRDILPWLETKHVLSTKPLSLKRQTTILETQGSIWMKLILFAILKKGQWTGQEPERQLLKECLGRNEQLSWTDESGWPLLVQLVFAAPHIFENNNEHIHASNGHLVYHLVHRALQLEQYPDSMATYMMQQPAYATKALVQGIKEDNRRSLELTGALVRQVTTSKDAFEIGSMFIKELLPLVSRSHTACEALITCMDITDIPSLILKLMAMTNTSDTRTSNVCKGLIAKALLSNRWVDGYGVLVIIDMVRDFKHTRRFTTEWAKTDISSPDQLLANSKKEETGSLTDQQVFELSMGLLSTVHLWSMKAQKETIENGLRQFVVKTYAAPSDDTFLTAWHYLSPAFTNHPSSIWAVLQAVSSIMKEQPAPSRTDDESLVYCRVSPLLILKSLPSQSFTDVKLYHTVTGWTEDGLQFTQEDIKWTKEPFAHQDTSRMLFEELLSRVQRRIEYDIVRDLAQEMLKKVYCMTSSPS